MKSLISALMGLSISGVVASADAGVISRERVVDHNVSASFDQTVSITCADGSTGELRTGAGFVAFQQKLQSDGPATHREGITGTIFRSNSCTGLTQHDEIFFEGDVDVKQRGVASAEVTASFDFVDNDGVPIATLDVALELTGAGEITASTTENVFEVDGITTRESFDDRYRAAETSGVMSMDGEPMPVSFTLLAVNRALIVRSD